jgi:MFS transporter, ACS family, hexuronate transporter
MTSTPPPLPDTTPLPRLDLERRAAGPMTHFRWVILGLVFLGTTINYVDRMVMGILAPSLQAQYHISNTAYGYIQSAFSIAYALGQLASGAWLDRIGTRIGYALALAAWSVSSALHAVARGPWSFGLMRGMLGVSESPNFPAAVKTLAEWFPKRERALAMGVVNAGTNVGAVLAPLAVPWLALRYGWQWAFIGTAALGLCWLGLWLPIYRRPHEHLMVAPAELAYINSDPPEPAAKVRWRTILGYRQAWAFCLGKFLTDPIWSIYLFWLPMFLHDHHKLDLQTIGWPLVTVYVMADVGSIGGGWLSSGLIRRGWSVNAARKAALLACALAVIPIVFAADVAHLRPIVALHERLVAAGYDISVPTWNLWVAVALVGLATAAHQGFSSNLYTLVSDTFPRRTVGSVAGLGGTFGYLGVTLFSAFIGYVVDRTGQYRIPFIIAGVAYLVALALIQVLAPRLEPAVVDEAAAPAT